MSEWKETEIGILPFEWDVATLQDIAELITDGSHLSPKEISGGKFMASVKDMTYSGFDFSNCKTISEEDFDSLKRNNCSPLKGDILISKDGANCLDLIFVYNQEEEIVLLSSIAIVRLKEKYNSSFYRNYLLSPVCQGIMKGWFVSGSAIPRVVLKDFKKVPVPVLKNKKEADEIAKTIDSFDNKIDLLRRQNQTLEQLAQTIFKQWFVHYQYPGANRKMQQTELGDVPEGWRIGCIGDIYKITSGGTPSRAVPEYYQNGTIEWIKSKELDGHFVINTEEKITEEAMNNSSAKLLPENSVLIAMYGNTVGELGLTAKPATCNQAICAIIEMDVHSFSYAYLSLKHNLQKLKNLAIGSAQQNLSQVVISNFEILIPDKKTAFLFSSSVNPLFEKIKLHQKEIQTLTQLRDSLLPRLMSGRLRVG